MNKTLLTLTVSVVTCASLAAEQFNIPGVPSIPGMDKAEKYKSMADKGADAFSTLTPEGREKIGQTVALAATDKYGGLDSRDNVQTYVTLVGMTVARAADPKQDKGKFYFAVLDSDEVAACSAPAGYVMITRGLLKLCSDESELAGVLGHEISHVVKDHGLDSIRAQRGMNFLSAMNSDVAQFTTMADGWVTTALSSPFSQGQESDADKASLNYLAKAGYDPQGYVRFLKKLQAAKAGNQSVLSTHPSPKDRIKAAEKKRQIWGCNQCGAVCQNDRALSHQVGHEFFIRILIHE